MAVLLPSVGVLARLHHATAITAITTDAAREVAVDPASWPTVRHRLVASLGSEVLIQGSVTPTSVRVTVSGRSTGPRGFRDPLVRGVQVRREVGS